MKIHVKYNGASRVMALAQTTMRARFALCKNHSTKFRRSRRVARIKAWER